MRSKLERYYTQRTNNILQILQKFETSVSEENLHIFRVEMKKLRALLRFLGSEYGKSAIKKTKKAIDLIFDEAGTLREQQLVLAWFGKNRLRNLQKNCVAENPLPEGSKELQEILHAIRKKLAARLAKNQSLIAKTTQAATDQYTAALKHRIEESLRKVPAEPEWHTLRKLIKQWLYAVNWTSTSKSTSLSHLYVYSNQLQEAIGSWHDAINMHITLLSMKSHLPKEAAMQKEHATALQKILTTIQRSSRAVEKLLHHSGLAGKNSSSLS
jgi:CHAD domain-containing protein